MSANPSTSTKWDYESYAAIPDDGKRHEIVDGEHFVNPAPNLYHQTVSRRIQFQLYTQIELAELGQVFDAPVDVQLSEHDIVQPDLVIVSKDKRNIMTPTKIKGVPNLIVEILSPSNRDHDRKRKRTLYQRNQVPEYWIVDPEEHSILQLVLIDGAYQEHVHRNTIKMSIPPGALVDLTKVW
ncbi:MAG: Uma2 family endonuclease [Pirellulaceae bacterium]